MSDGGTPRDKSLLDQAKDAIDDFFGGNVREAAQDTPSVVTDQMNMDDRQLQDVGMGVRGVQGSAYAGSAGEQALEAAEHDVPGTSPRGRGADPPDSALEPF